VQSLSGAHDADICSNGVLGTLVLFMIPETRCQTLEILVSEVSLGTGSSSRTGKGGLIARLT
jgi:hypothetical protein